MKLIVFQGNPGLRYRKTRHNMGFMVGDYLAIKGGLKWKKNAKFDAEIAEMADKTLLVKPQTFYNETGRTARGLVDFYKIDPKSDLLVVCDDINLDFGTVRTRAAGSDGGNNGLKSISAAVGEEFARLRIGTDNELRQKLGDIDFVLSKFNKDEWAQMPDILERSTKVIQDFIDGQFEVKKSH